MIYDARSFPQPSVFWTRDLWDLAGLLDEELYFAMDYALWLQMRLRAECEIILDDVLSIARSHPDQKGVTAKREGWLYKFTQQRAIIAVRAAVARGEHPLIWLYQIWSHRIISAFTRRKFSLIFGSSFHREATRIVIRNILWRE
jgi:hypothetical protein